MKNFKKGFTLIELLVVVAIIGILASVVLASLNTARAKGANAAVKANMDNLRAQASIIYDSANPNSYAGITSDATFTAGLAAAGTAGGGTPVKYGDANGWVAATALKTGEGTSNTLVDWCVDSAGKSEGITAVQMTAITGSTTLCP